MRVLIFEGIATSGKSSLISEVTRMLSQDSALVIGEDQSHIPIMNDREDPHEKFFIDLISERARQGGNTIVLIDRLHLTQAIRSHSKISDYAKLEELLMSLGAELVILTVPEPLIAERIMEATTHREQRWKDYVTKVDPAGPAAYYTMQQREILSLADESNLKKNYFDVTKSTYKEIARQLVE